MPDLATSWTRRLFERTGIATVWLGIALLTIAVLVFVVQELALGRLATVDDTTLERVRITFTHIVITAYLITAYVYCEQARDESIASLRPLLDPERADPLVDTKTRDRAILPLAALIGVAGSIWVGLNVAPDPGSYDPRDWTPETGWHRVLSIFMGFWTGRLSLLIVIESGRLSDLAATLREIDLLDLNALAPFARSGLTNALLVIGSVAVSVMPCSRSVARNARRAVASESTSNGSFSATSKPTFDQDQLLSGASPSNGCSDFSTGWS